MQERKKYYYLDMIRIYAILYVIFIHTDMAELYLQMPLGSVSYYIFLYSSLWAAFTPSVFFMVSGALLMEKEEPISGIWKKRIARIAADLFILTLLYFILDIKSGRCEPDPVFFLKQLFSRPWITPYWYLYSYLSFLICLPFVRGMAKVMTEKTAVYLFVLGVFLQSIFPEMLRHLPAGFEIYENLRWDWLLNSTVLFPLLGYAIHKKTELLKRKRVVFGLIIADLFWLCYQTGLAASSCIGSGQNILCDNYRGTCTILHAVTVFCAFKYLQEKEIFRKGEKVFAEISSCVFGIYLFHGFFLDRIRIVGKIKYLLFSHFSGPALVIPSVLWILLIFGMTGAVVWLLRRIPPVRKFI